MRLLNQFSSLSGERGSIGVLRLLNSFSRCQQVPRDPALGAALRLLVYFSRYQQVQRSTIALLLLLPLLLRGSSSSRYPTAEREGKAEESETEANQ